MEEGLFLFVPVNFVKITQVLASQQTPFDKI